MLWLGRRSAYCEDAVRELPATVEILDADQPLMAGRVPKIALVLGLFLGLSRLFPRIWTWLLGFGCKCEWQVPRTENEAPQLAVVLVNVPARVCPLGVIPVGSMLLSDPPR